MSSTKPRKAQKADKTKTRRPARAARASQQEPAFSQLPAELEQLLPEGTTQARIVAQDVDPRARRVFLVEGQHKGSKAWFVLKEIVGLILGPLVQATAQNLFAAQAESSNKGA